VNAIAATLMSTCLLAHALLGCCWHHEHACITHGTAAHDAAAHESVAHADGSCDHHNCPGDQRAPCDCRLECGAVCVFVQLQKTIVDGSPTASDVVAIDPALRDNRSETRLSWELATSAGHSPPLRLHLLHQILLI
jgi:hypothetical protein